MIIPSVIFGGVVGDGPDHLLGVNHREEAKDQKENDKRALHITGGLFNQDQAKVVREP